MSSSLVKIEPQQCSGAIGVVPSTKLQACRACLSTDTKLLDLHKHNLGSALEDLIGTPVAETDGMPQYVCSVCCGLLQKSTWFRDRCRKAHVYLQDILCTQLTITTELLQCMDKTQFPSRYSKTHTLTFEYVPLQDAENTLDLDNGKGNFKLDASMDTLVNNTEYYPADFPDVDFLEDTTIDIKEECEIKEDYISTNSYDEIPSVVVEDLHIDNEEEEIKKNKAVKKVKKKEGKTKKADKPKGRKYNKKTVEDFANFSEIYKTDVKFLTKEQQVQEVVERKDNSFFKSCRFKCDTCYRGFMMETAYEKHMATHDPSSGSHLCEVCHIRFPTQPRLQSHKRQHQVRFVCHYCNHVSKDSTSAKLHFKWHQGYKYECKYCKKHFNKPSTHMNHVREYHTPVACAVCRATAAGTRGLADHKLLHEQRYKCTSCDAQFHSEAARDKHMGSAPENFCPALKPCVVCGENFQSDELMKSHMLSLHKGSLFSCGDCSATFTTDRSLGMHWSRAHKAGAGDGAATGGGGRRKPSAGVAAAALLMCEVCAKSFKSDVQLKYHQLIHTNERPHACPLCPKRFRMACHLKVHINTHTGQRPFKCPLCPEAFKSYSQKYKHGLLVHTKERRHKCHMCEKTYVVSCDLKMHIRTAHMKIPLPPRNRRKKNKTS